MQIADDNWNVDEQPVGSRSRVLKDKAVAPEDGASPGAKEPLTETPSAATGGGAQSLHLKVWKESSPASNKGPKAKESDSTTKRNRAIRLGNSIRKAVNPRNQQQQQKQQPKQSLGNCQSSPDPPLPTRKTKACISVLYSSAVPMTPISLECKPFDINDCITARPEHTSHSFTSSSFQHPSTDDQSEPITEDMSSSFSLPLASSEPPAFSPFPPCSNFDNHPKPSNPCPPYHPDSPVRIPSTPSFDQDSILSPTPSPYRSHQGGSTQSSSSHQRYPSQSILTIALAKAQTAVQLDTALQIPEAIRAYTEAVLLLEEVIDKIDVMSKEREQKEQEGLMRDQIRDRLWAEELWKHLGREDVKEADREEMESRLNDRERRWRDKQKKMEKRKKARADEEDRLIGIHNTYASRIAELQAEVLLGRLHIIDPDKYSTDSCTMPSNVSQESIDQLALQSTHQQPVYSALPEAECTSTSSDSTTRGGTSSELQEPKTLIQPTTREQASRITQFRNSFEIAEEEKDVVSERLPAPLHYSTSHSQHSRNRSSSSISGTSLSQPGRPHSVESVTTTRSSISSNPHKPDPWIPTIVQKSSKTQFEVFDGQKRFSINNSHVSHHQPASNPSSRTSISIQPESLSTVVPPSNAHQIHKRPSSQKILVSDTTTQGAISQRRRSPTCVDAKGSLLPKADDCEGWDVLSLLPPSSSSSPDTTLGLGKQIAISMDLRPSNVSLMCTAPSPAIPLRLRSFSQPGKRPSLLSFIADKTPPVPSSPIRTEPLQPSSRSTTTRQSSSPLANNGSQQDPPVSRSTSFISSPSPLSHNTNHGSTPPAVYGIQPYTHASLSAGSVHVGGLAPAGVLPAYPKSASRRPFHLMRQISTSISTGAYVSPRLYVPRQMWFQVQVKLHGLDTKIKLMDTLLAGLELVERDGGVLVGGVEGPIQEGNNWEVDVGRQPSSTTVLSSQVLNATKRFMKRLEIFEELLDSLQTGGAKKLGLHGNGPHETAYGQDALRKGGSFGTLMAHKLGKGLDRITQRSNTDLPTSYIETIARLFEKSQAIDVHLASLEQASRSHSSLGNNAAAGGGGLYNSISQQSKQHIEGRLRRVSEFYSTVVCRFVVADMGVLLDKYVKRGGNWCGD